ncbi:hypothetical protein SAMN04487864_101173 [Succiniclasticum ruminis]|uniref:Uncharacterized protein n=1 Tax=Succiniclasticum ruminis TaxID=40841 RepID=A0A1G6HQT6_9FIRM|nr:hypothetical protein SAMN04487864_101173 [Succiniclasticum ruminis]
MEHREVPINTTHWISRIMALTGCLMGFHAIKQLGI